MAHTDVKIPDFKEYRNSYSEDPHQSSKANADDKQTFSYISTFGVGLATAYGAKAIVRDIVANVAPSADVLALAKIEVNLNDIPEGKNLTVKWRNKPLFIRHRTAAEIANEQAVDVGSLRDPQTDESRVKKPEYLVVLGICTHLGSFRNFSSFKIFTVNYFRIFNKDVCLLRVKVISGAISAHVTVLTTTSRDASEKAQLHLI